MELKEITRGNLRVTDGARTITICGEAYLRGFRSSDFVLYQNSIEKWDAQDHQKDATSTEKERLLQFLKMNSPEEECLLKLNSRSVQSDRFVTR